MSFELFARAHGLVIPVSKLYPSQSIRRCGLVDKPKSLSGSFFWDGERGWVWNWAAEAKAQWYESETARRWTAAEKEEWLAQRRRAKNQQEKAYVDAANRAQEIIKSCKAGTHSYLDSKGFKESDGLIAPDGRLVIPMRDYLQNKVMGIQFIYWNEAERKHEKKMMPGMKAKGATIVLGDRHAPETCLCEGYATGLSIMHAIKSSGIHGSVTVCFSAHNMAYVAPFVYGKAYIFADNDRSHTGELTAQKTELPFCMSEVEGYDANDVHVKQGLLQVTKLIMGVRNK